MQPQFLDHCFANLLFVPSLLESRAIPGSKSLLIQVLEIDGSSLRVRQATVIQDLQQDIENV